MTEHYITTTANYLTQGIGHLATLLVGERLCLFSEFTEGLQDGVQDGTQVESKSVDN